MFWELFLASFLSGNIANHTINNFQEIDADLRIVASNTFKTQNISSYVESYDPDIKLNAILHLTKNSNTSTYNILLKFLNDNDFRVRGNAAIVLGKLNFQEAIPRLTLLLKDQHYTVRAAAALSLGRLKAYNSINELIETLDDTNDSVKLSVIYSLCAIESNKAVKPLIKLLNDSSSAVRENSAWVLGQLKSIEALPYLTLLTKDPDLKVRSSAKRSIFFIKYSLVSDISNVNYSGGKGTNFDDAVKINGIKNTFACLRSQKEYINRFYGNQTTWEQVDQAYIEHDKKHYQLITIKESNSGNLRKFYFDITDFFNKF